jgi:hypothetical protein
LPSAVAALIAEKKSDAGKIAERAKEELDGEAHTLPHN